jgi:hypothetical protein
MLQTMDTVNRALLWTMFAGLTFVVWMQARARLRHRDRLSSLIGEHHLITFQVISALLATSVVVGSLELFFLPTILVAHAAPVPSETAVVAGYTLPDANVSVIQVQGEITQRPASRHGEWRIGSYTFSTDAQTMIQVAPDQPAVACLVQHDGGEWKATVIAPASNAPVC